MEALQKKDFPNSQIMALDALQSLSGRLTATGNSYTEAWLLKIAGFDQPYHALVKTANLKTFETDLTETMVCIYLVFGLFDSLFQFVFSFVHI